MFVQYTVVLDRKQYKRKYVLIGLLATAFYQSLSLGIEREDDKSAEIFCRIPPVCLHFFPPQ